MRKWLIKKLGGYHKDEVLTEAVKHLYNTIGADDILKIEGQFWTIAGEEIDEATKRLLISEANIFLNTRLWKVLQIDIKYKANKKMFLESQSELDLVAGKLWQYTLDCISTRLKQLTK